METKIGLAVLVLLLIISCRKENTTIQSFRINEEKSSSQARSDITEFCDKAVRIGAQVWMKKNLSVSRYRNGDRIPQVRDPAAWASLTTGAWCWYNNDSATGAVYGTLYNWYAVNDSRGLAPVGWHIPNNDEWTTLATFLGGEAVAGGKLKSTGTIEAVPVYGMPPNKGATNRSGFMALPDGYRPYSGEFRDIGSLGFWWSSTEEGILGGVRALYYENRHFPHYSGIKQNGCSVRCLQDSLP